MRRTCVAPLCRRWRAMCGRCGRRWRLRGRRRWLRIRRGRWRICLTGRRCRCRFRGRGARQVSRGEPGRPASQGRTAWTVLASRASLASQELTARLALRDLRARPARPVLWVSVGRKATRASGGQRGRSAGMGIRRRFRVGIRTPLSAARMVLLIRSRMSRARLLRGWIRSAGSTRERGCAPSRLRAGGGRFLLPGAGCLSAMLGSWTKTTSSSR
jgi:hypothetical protein